MDTARDSLRESCTLTMEYDYTSLCNCGDEQYHNTLAVAKEKSKFHLRYCTRKDGEIYINRHFKGSDIDDTFKDVRITKAQVFNGISQQILNNFFGQFTKKLPR